MRLILLLNSLLFFQSALSQTTFKLLYGATGADAAQFVEVLPDGSFIVAGYAAGSGQDALLTRFNPDGTISWSKTFGGSGTDIFTRLLTCSDGNFIALGETSSYGAGSTDIYIVKFNPAGNVIWERTAGGSNLETARGICEVPGGYVITGSTQSFGAGFWDLYVVRLDLGGNSLWAHAWGSGGGDIAGEPLPAPNNEIWFTGFVFIGTGNHDAFLFRLSSSGALLSANQYTASGNDGCGSLVAGGPGLAGSGGTWSYTGNTQLQPFILGLTPAASIAWARRYPIAGGNYEIRIEEAPGGFICAPYNINNNTPEAILFKVDAGGNVQFAKSYAFESTGRILHARATPDGGYIAVGFDTDQSQDVFILKTDALGNVQQCCPQDISISAIPISPGNVPHSTTFNAGPGAQPASGTNANLAGAPVSICTGPVCCIPPPVAVANGPAITCNNPTVTLNGAGSSAGPDFTYQWSGPGIVSGGNTLQPTVNLPGTYTLVVTNNILGCSDTTTLNVANQTQLPTAIATAPTPLTCLLPSVPITGIGSSAGPGIVYSWTTADGNIVSGANTLTPLVNAIGTYTLTVTNTLTGCVNTAAVTVVPDNSIPVAEAGPPQQLDCANFQVSLDASASSQGPNIQFQWSGPGIVLGGNTPAPLVNAPGTYTLTLLNTTNGCSDTDAVSVTQNLTPPQVQIAPPANISCLSPQVQLNASGSSQGPEFVISWTTPNGSFVNGTDGLTPTVDAPGIYFLQITDTLNSCLELFSVEVTGSTEPPLAEAGPGGLLTCTQTQLSLQGSVSGPTGHLALSWMADPGNILAGQNGLTPLVDQPGTYILTALDTLTGCFSQDSLVIDQDADIPNVLINPSNPLNCLNPTLTLDASASSQGPDLVLTWTTPDGLFLDGQQTLAPLVGAGGWYTLTIWNPLTACADSAAVLIVPDTLPPLFSILPPDTLTCVQTEANLTASFVQTAGLSLWWSTPDGNISGNNQDLQILADAPGTYILAATDTLSGCAWQDSVQVLENIASPLAAIDPPGVLNCLDTLLVLSSQANAGWNYQWTTPDGLILGGATGPDATIASPGTYTLVVTNPVNGCAAQAQTAVTQDIAPPLADAGPGGVINCYQDQVTLAGMASVSGALFQYQWTTPDGLLLGDADGLQPLAGAAGTYIFTVTNLDNFCAAQSQALVVEDLQPPVADAGPDGVLTCSSPAMSLAGTGSLGPAFVYTWTSPDGSLVSGSNTLTPLINTPGTYALEVFNTQNGCLATDTVIIQSDNASPVAIAASPAPITCGNPTVQLDATASVAEPNWLVEWTGNILSGANTLTPTVDQPGAYTLLIANPDNGCASSTTVQVGQDLAQPLATAQPLAQLNCYQPQVALSAQGSSSGSDYLIQWTTLDGLILSGAETLSPLVGGPGIYTLNITNLINQCVDQAQVVVAADFQAPFAEAGPGSALTCVQQTLSLAGNGSQGSQFQYAWSTSDGQILSGAQTLAPLVAAPGLYTLEVRDTLNGCLSSDQVLVNIDTLLPPVAIAPPPQLTCALTSLSLDATASASGPDYLAVWTTADGSILAGGNTLTPLVDAPGEYFLEITDTGNGCASSAWVEVLEDVALPLAQAAVDGALTCAQTAVQLLSAGSSAGPDFIETWSAPGGQPIGPSLQVAAPGSYVLVITDQSNGCTATDTVWVTADTLAPLAAIAAPGLLTCLVDTLALDAGASSSGPGFVYSWNTANGNILEGAAGPFPLIDAPGLYGLTIVNLVNGCVSYIEVAVLQDIQPPLADAGAMAGVNCYSAIAQLSGTASASGGSPQASWSTADGQILSDANTLTPQVGAPGTYWLTVADPLNGCTATDSVVVTEDVEIPTVVLAQPDTLTCLTTTLFLDGTGSDSGPLFEGNWTASGGGLILSGAQTLTPEAGAPGFYTLTVINLENGCTDSATVWVAQNIQPPLAEAGEGFVLPCWEDTYLLEGMAFTASGQMGINWYSAGGQIAGGQNTLTPAIAAAGTYWIEITDLVNGCQALDSVAVLENPPLNPLVEWVLPTCTLQEGQIHVVDMAGGTPGYLYSVDGGETFQPSPVFEFLPPGDYSVVAEDALGCRSAAVAVSLPAAEPLTLELDTEVEMLQGDTFQIEVFPSVPPQELAQISWTPAAGLSCADCLNPLAAPQQTTEYTLTVRDEKDCEAMATLRFRVDERPLVYVPNVFSPNGDGQNEVFFIFARSENIREIRSFLVFDRWGERVFEYYHFQPNHPAFGWDGRFRGQDLNPAVFVWFAEIEMTDGRLELFKGDVTLVR